MPKYVEFQLQDGTTILIESADEKKSAGGGFVPTARGGDEPTEKAKVTFEQAIQSIQSSANLLVSKLRDLSQPPDELEVTFSLKTSAEVGTLFVARGGAEASYNVALRWRREEKRDEKEEQAGE
jgi:hypothetical protein